MAKVTTTHQRQTLCRTNSDNVPPFFEADCSIVVLVDLREESVQSGIGHRESSAAEGSLKLFFIKLAIVVVVDTREKSQQLLFGLLDECAKFFEKMSATHRMCIHSSELTVVLYTAVPVGIYCAHHLIKEAVRIFQRCRLLLARNRYM